MKITITQKELMELLGKALEMKVEFVEMWIFDWVDGNKKYQTRRLTLGYPSENEEKEIEKDKRY